MIYSEAVNHGLNHDKGTYKDNRYIRCGRCGWVCHLDRDTRERDGSTIGYAITYVSMAYDTDYQYDAPLVYNGTRPLYDPQVTGGCPQCGTLMYHKYKEM